ncbi:hypothetical protein K503DRAFT_219455 [Rhizopogon vinicolor AM-OR11-026]|uniref:Uncharacterized protein n=1 Tax=Rhizopogon vinicolor AM-OR11-026 TaxID=1314800 RepID=A0A1B7MYI9_9AGAM|nr:hypothetical protein K503DRAFT_219455 [Rhizopogon vinicolor AM-OR11-026]
MHIITASSSTLTNGKLFQSFLSNTVLPIPISPLIQAHPPRYYSLFKFLKAGCKTDRFVGGHTPQGTTSNSQMNTIHHNHPSAVSSPRGHRPSSVIGHVMFILTCLQNSPIYITNETTSTRLMEEAEEHLPLLGCVHSTLFLTNRAVQAGRSGN